MDPPDHTTTATVARFIQRFREDEPNPRDARKAMKADCCWWVRSQKDDLLTSSRPKAAQHGPCTKPGYERIPPRLQPHPADVESGDSEHKGAALNWTSPLARDMSPRHLPMGELEAVELMNSTSEKERRSLLVLGAGCDAESSVQDEPVRAYEGESDELAHLDARAHTLLEHCWQLLAPSSTPSDKVSTAASADLEERARTLLTKYKCLSDRPCIPEAQKVAKVSIGEDPELSCDGCFGERRNARRFQQDQGNVRGVDSVTLAAEKRKCSVLMSSLLDDVCRAGDGNKCGGSLFSSVLARSGSGERTEWLRDDPVLSALLRRFAKIEAEIERRHSSKSKWRKLNGHLEK